MLSVHAISGTMPVTAGASVDASLPPELLPELLPLPARSLLELEHAAIPPAALVAVRATIHRAKVLRFVTVESFFWETLQL
jgi:hypothetical protein